MKLYRHLFFDLDNTVWDFNQNSWHAMLGAYLKFNLDRQQFENFFEIYTRHNDRLWEEYRKSKVTKPELIKLRFELSFAEAGIPGIDGVKFNTVFLSLMPLQTRLCDGAMPVLEKLSAKYQMHIITNGFSEVQYKKLENSQLKKFFKRVFVSEELKAPKPSPEIFRHALKSCNARKNESLMIGDSWDVDIIGAMKVGIDQVHYAPFEQNSIFSVQELEQIENNKTNTYRINHLEQLLVLL